MAALAAICLVAGLRRAGIARRLPHTVLMDRPKGHGGGLYSRFPIAPLPRQTHFLFRMPRAVLTLPDGRRLRVVAVHPQPPNMSLDRWRRLLDRGHHARHRVAHEAGLLVALDLEMAV